MEEFTTPLVSVDWLAQNLEAENLVILNATLPKVGSTSNSNGTSKQIKGARFFDIKKAFSDTNSDLPNTFPSEQQFEIKAQELGISADSYIVVYDDHGIYSSPRAWWLFKSFGHENIAVLNGGFPAWQAGGLPVEDLNPYAGKKGNFKANYQKKYIKNFNEILSLLNSGNTKILDARSQDRFNGNVPEPREGLRSGHIPSSKNLPYLDVLEDGKMISRDELTKKFENYHGEELVFSCGSGITACILALGAELAGHKKLSVYDGSWTEWGSRHELPIEIGN